MQNNILSILTQIKKDIDFNISNSELISIALDVSRVADNKITKRINEFKNEHKIKFTRVQKNNIRDYLIGMKKDWKVEGFLPIKKNIINDIDIYTALNVLQTGIARSPAKVLGTIQSRLTKDNSNNIKNEYKDIINEIQKNEKQLLIIHIKPDGEDLLNQIKETIVSNYDSLSNYHNLAVIFENVDWSLIAKTAIFSENFTSENQFKVFNKQKQKKIDELCNFLEKNENIDFNLALKEEVNLFYSNLSCGFQFNDLFISSSGKIKILLLQKIHLDERVYPCPDCMKKNVRGNSYPKLLKKSFECQNPNCPSRSKIGRGKRFDLLSVKRNLKLEENNDCNLVDIEFSKKFRRDIFESDNYFEMLIRFYSWSNDNVLVLRNFKNTQNKKILFDRAIEYKNINTQKIDLPTETPFERLFSSVIKNIKIKNETPTKSISKKNFSVYLGNSSTILSKIPQKITGAITSPPYYNAREYSQWPTLICYLIDMAINSLAVYKKLEKNTYYFYNIGDIVGQDNVYISSNMSKRRLMLGFYSILVFEKVGFHIIDNIIWDKGEVQSKRNSTENLFPGYIKPINCYEHILIFGKNNKSIKLNGNLLKLNSVKKINSKGENILGHTAPYPENLVEIIFDYIDRGGYLLDPFLGSGTTTIAGIKKEIKTVGIELNETYYELALERINSTNKKNLKGLS